MSTSINVHASYTDEEKVGNIEASFTSRPATIDVKYTAPDMEANHVTIFFVGQLSDDQLRTTVASFRSTADEIENYLIRKAEGCV